ncbi:hypothetical protein U1Q18_038918 [Sarracenia purpurea var. burkii]
MTTVVPTSEEDPALSVVRFTSELSWADAGPEVMESQVKSLCFEAQECIVMGRWMDLASLMLTSADLIFSKVSEKDLECIFTVICNLVTKSETLDESLEMAKHISTKITQQPNDKPALRLKIMFNLYNLLENPYSRFFVYVKALDLAVNGKATEYIIPSFKKMDDFLREWNIGIQDQRELFLKISNILKESKSSARDSFKFLMKYLATYSGEDAYSVGEAKEEAVRTIIEFVKAPDMFQINDDEVEMWVVRAISAKLIGCKMDQMNKIVIVSRCTERIFGQDQWQTLRAKLAAWRGNIANVISTIQTNKVTEDGAQAVQGLIAR